MKIKDVSEKTGLTKKTIRFYETEGLLAPEKTWLNGREYRSYSEADVQQLLKIAALRRARFSVEEIRHIQSVPEDIPTVFQDYRHRLQQDQRDLTAILAVINNISCETLTDEDALIAQMTPATTGLPLPAADLDPHFRYLDELEELSGLVAGRLPDPMEHQRSIAANGAVMYAAFSQSTQPDSALASRTGSGFEPSASQKIATYNLLLHSRKGKRKN